jgi:HK97 family phage major capsid protein
MRNSELILKELDAKIEAIRALRDSFKDGEKPTDEQNKDWKASLAAKRDLEAELEMSEEAESFEKAEKIRLIQTAGKVAGSGAGRSTNDKEDNDISKFSFTRAISSLYGEKVDGIEGEMLQEGANENRGIGKAARGVVIPSTVLNHCSVKNRANIVINGTGGVQATSFLDNVYANTILGDLGVDRIDAVLDQRIPIIGKVTSTWEGETDAAADGGAALSKADLTPVRLASYVNFSKQASMQHADSLESSLRRNIAKSVGETVEKSVFTSVAGAPAYLGTGKTPVTGATMQALVNALVEEIMGNNHFNNSCKFAITHQLYGEVMNAVQVTGVSALVGATEKIHNMLYKFSTQIADITNPVSYFGDWSYLKMAQFGGVEVLFDPYTQSRNGMDSLVLNSYWDHALALDAAVSVGGYTG